MADPRLYPDDLIMQLRQLEQRVRELESSNRLVASDVGGLMVVTNSSGQTVAEIGLTNANNVTGGPPVGTIGICIYDPSTGNVVFRAGTNVDLAGNPGVEVRDTVTGFTAFMATTQGFVLPSLCYQTGPINPFVTPPWNTTSATMVAIYESHVHRVPANAVRHRAIASVPAGSTGEIEMFSVNSGLSTNPKTVNTSGAAASFDFNWLHGAAQHVTSTFQLRARLTSGAGPISIYDPRSGFDFQGGTLDGSTSGG